ncbi:MAG TPA: DNA recombination protein RmuC [Caldimonas sp.]|nr:DNA recombination protein RmuC [Caldimonas sp.]
MVFEWLTPSLLALLVVIVLWIALRRPPADAGVERQARDLRDEILRSAQGTRQELGTTLADFQRTSLAQQGEVARTQNEQARLARESLDATLAAQGLRQTASLKDLAESLNNQLQALVRANDQRMGEVRLAVETRLAAIQQDNEKKLEQIRATVDEKLHATLEHRLGESFRQVAERLEQVHRGIGEMQKLASDVGSLNRVLTNVKSRGLFGEVQLASLLEQALTLEQYATNVETVPGSGARVEFAIKLPGRRDDGAPLWLPIDCKFPRDDYERLVEAQEAADRIGVETYSRAIEARLRREALTIREKYVAPPHTTDFGIMFLPTEGLYAEALRRPGLVESLQREYKVMLTGPTTLLATLSSLQMGFRTLALEKRSAEVWETLGAVKTEFSRFGDVLAKTKKKLDEASSSIEMAERRTRVMARELRGVESLSDERAQTLLPGSLFDDDAADA